ncbi:MAG TPA: DMT family transporter [Terriglobales bacterium]|jgi:drug/metabolite transporter (DMT)-like permease|nr:DMT family transporter [Terriglobales bacterium]
MSASTQFVPAGFSLAATLCWGTSDFLGGYASRRSDAFVVTLLAHASGFGLMAVLAVANHAPFPAHASEIWALVAGALGGTGLALFYRALSSGRMGLTAPVAAVLGAAIPTVFGIFLEGVPGAVAIAGFLLAGLGIWLISRPEDTAGRPEGLGLAVLAGLGFAGFYICIHRVGDSSALWSAAHSRFGSLVMVAAMVLLRRKASPLRRRDALLGLIAGCLDSTGTLLFIRADQTGRLDSAVVLTSLYPAVTVLLARWLLREHFTRWKAVGILAALAAVPLIALR